MTAKDSTTRVISDSGDDIGPGQRLREAREAAQLSLGEVASRMRLEPHVLERLENDQYERLHGPTFVRGYLSGYARLLDLPEGPILEAYERRDHRPPALVSELGRKPEVHVSDFPVRMVTYVIAGLLVVLVVLWWQSRQLHTGAPERADGSAQPTRQSMATPTDEATSGDSATTSPAKMDSAPESPPTMAPGAADAGPEQQPVAPVEPPQTASTGSEASALETETAAAVEPSGEAESLASGASASEAVVTESSADSRTATAGDADAGTAQADAPSTSQALPAVTAAPPAAANEALESAAGVEAETLQPPRPEPLPGSDRLAIQFKHESWVEIYDRGGGRLYYSLASEGSEVVVQGAGPMRVLLGDVEGAAVAYNGEPFDLSRYKGRSVVRFTVGEDSQPPAPRQATPPAAPREPLNQGAGQRPPASGESDSVADAREALTPAPAATAGNAPARPAGGADVEKPLPAKPAAAAEAPQNPAVGALPDS